MLKHPLKFAFFFRFQEGVSRQDLSSDGFVNNDEFDESEGTETGEGIVNLSNNFSENSMSETYQNQSRTNHVSKVLKLSQFK